MNTTVEHVSKHRTLKIFLASSGTLEEERVAIERFIRRESDRLSDQDLSLKLVIWEELSKSFSKERIQNRFNEAMLDCDMVIALFFDKVGEFTLEEFENAYKSLKAGGKPKYLFVYFKDAQVNINEVDPLELINIRELKKRIEQVEQIYDTFDSIPELENKVKRQLDLLPELQTKPDILKDNAVISPPPIKPEPCLADYLKQCLQDHRHLNMHGFETTLRMPIELERVYVHMKANIGNIGMHAEDGTDFHREREIGQVDIKGTFKASDRLHVKDIIILGGPGSGKTTLLKFICVMIAEKQATGKLGLPENLIPFFVPLRDLHDPDKEPFEEFVLRVCKCGNHEISEGHLLQFLREGKAVILLDGLDEVANEELRMQTCRWIDAARGKYVNTRFIITSRFTGYLGKVRLGEPAVLELSIQHFTPDESRAFLERWFETVEVAMKGGDESVAEAGRNKGIELAEDIQKDTAGHLQKLAINPLLLQIIALVRYDRGTALPDRRVELYRECTDVLLEKWDMAKGLKGMLTAEQSRQILQPIALWLHQEEERRSATFDEIKHIVAEALETIGKSNIDPEALFLNIRDRSGIFMGYGTDEYGFTHLSFQEYLAAEHVRNTLQVDLLVDTCGVKWWREVTLLALSLTNPSIIIEFMRRIVHTMHFPRDITIITDSINDSIIKPVQPFVETVNDEGLPVKVRLNALRVLAEMADDKVIDCLRQAAESGDKAIGRAAYAALVKLGRGGDVAEPSGELPERIRTEKDGADMVLVPEGTFLYGSKEDDPEAQSDEKPQQSLYLPNFYIDVYPVTNEQYCRFLNEVKPEKQELEKWIAIGGGFLGEKNRLAVKGRSFTMESGREKHPVISVSWYGAEAYAKWAGKQLPSEVQWEKAARGADGRVYPWGDGIDTELCNYENKYNGTTPVDRLIKGVSPYGCFDMAGNVWEWCGDRYDQNNERDPEDPNRGPVKGSYRVLRGGSWDDIAGYCRCSYRDYYDPSYRFVILGFRVVFLP